MANRRPPWKIPDIIDPPERRCIQINIPEDPQHIAIFWGVLRGLSDWQRWERESTKSATLVAKVWSQVVYAIDWSGEECMGCCPRPTNRRFNALGQLEVSYDGGETWAVDNTLDDRFSGSVSPPIEGSDGTDKACAGAASAEEYVKQNLIDSLEDGTLFADLNSAGVALIALLGVTGVGLLVAAFAAAIFLAGVTAVQAAFTSEVWTTFRCILFCHISEDASFNEGQWNAVKADILAQYTGVVSAVLYNWVQSVGPVGLTNSARSHFVASADCTTCDCSCQFSVIFESGGWDEYTVEFGSVASNRLDLVTHTFPLGEGTGAKLEIDMIDECLVTTIPFDIQATNTRVGNTVSLAWEFFDATHTSVSSGGGDFAGVGDGTLQHLNPSITPATARYVTLFVGWLNDPGTNEGWIDNIEINH
jgi:hypothetical protein